MKQQEPPGFEARPLISLPGQWMRSWERSLVSQSFEDFRRNRPKKNDVEYLHDVAQRFCSTQLEGNKQTFDIRSVRIEYTPSVEFYFARLRITGHLSSVSACILLRLAQLWAGRRADIRDLVSQTMIERINETKVLCYPNLIRRLCERAGVDIRNFANGDTVEMNPPLSLPDLSNIGPLNLDIQPPPAAQYVRRPQ